MKNKFFLIGTFAVFIAEIVVLIIFAVQTPDFSQDTVAVNEVVQTVTADFNTIQSHNKVNGLDYVVLDENETVIFRTREGLSESANEAISHRDTLINIEIGGNIVGKVIIFNDGALSLQSQKQTAIIILIVAIAVQCAICVAYVIYTYLAVIKPFKKLKGFAMRVAGGNLDIPLEMDRQNLFGAFTESFDIMRSELKKARIAEAQANESKKELVAKLSHDIKTPVASIKAVAEVGLAVSQSERDVSNYTQIIHKTDQINTLITNLFSATLEELQKLSVNPAYVGGNCLKELLENSDYLRRATVPAAPDCLIFADKLRLQQVFDNIFANSYKYANTEISVTVEKCENSIEIIIEDFGGGVPEEELPVLKEKFKRGTNAEQIEGAGLGLYISDYFLKAMGGELKLENGGHGLKVTVAVLLNSEN